MTRAQALSSTNSSPSLSPFPAYSDSPLPMTPSTHPHISGMYLPPAAFERRETLHGIDDHELPRPVKWWPYTLLPPPHVVTTTMFPTLQGWSEKSLWDKFISVISVPSIFFLVITLPVVDTENNDHNSEETLVNSPKPGQVGNTAPPVSVEPDAALESETEWQRYRRATLSRSRSPSRAPSPVLVALDGVGSSTSLATPQQSTTSLPTLAHHDHTALSDDDDDWNRWLVIVQIFMGPLFTVLIVWANMAEDLKNPTKTLVRLILYSLLCSVILLGILLATTSPHVRPRYHFLLCFLGFIISIAWISSIAGEVVGVLKAFGVIIGISEAILGLTIFAVGNSVGDLVADVTVARLGYPVMALSACFGGPMLNILLGIGLGGAWMTVQQANHRHSKHPNQPIQYKPYEISLGGTLKISALTVLITLLFLLTAVPLNNWVMSRKIGYSLIAIWSISTIINVIVEATGFVA